MPQTVGYPGNGVELGKNRVRILTGVGAPSASSTLDVESAGVGSLYLRTDVGQLWQCTAAAVFTNGVVTTAATWTQLT
jgi:hypothetical protein